VSKISEEIVRGRSIEEIRLKWAQKWECHPDELKLEILEKPSLLSRTWKVKLSLSTEAVQKPAGTQDLVCEIEKQSVTTSSSRWEENRYIIKPGNGLIKIIPCKEGEILCNGVVQEKPFFPKERDILEFRPFHEPGHLTWELKVRHQGLSLIAKVKHIRPGMYVLAETITTDSSLDLTKHIDLKDLPPEGQYWDETRLDKDLEQIGVVYGRRDQAWSDIQKVVGVGEVVLAEANLPIAPQAAKLEDLVYTSRFLNDSEEQNVDFFASKIVLVKEGTVLARKTPCVPGVPGKDIFGKELPAATAKDFQFKLKKNVRLSDDGLEVLAACDGQPFHLEEAVYLVENVYLLNQDVCLETGSVEFPGDVFINGNVHDNLHVYAAGKVEIQGAVSKAEIRAEKGIRVRQNVIGGKLVVGEKYFVRSEIFRLLKSLSEELDNCLKKTAELMKVSEKASESDKNKLGQILKLVVERFYPDLPKIAANTEKYLAANKDDLIKQELMISVRTARHFLVGLGPLDPQAFPFLERVTQVLKHFTESVALEIPDKLICKVNYVQGATIESGGFFECDKGAYNSLLRVDGDIKIEGVCRGGKVISGGNISIKELGGAGVSTAFIQMSGNKRLKVNYCHPNVTICVDKEIIKIEEACKQLEIYRERGVVQIDKLKVNF
jgi:Predicted polymerase, most proteins contain PALM domain, HD hydrolase domain and Zn-ribbon domain